MIVMKSLQSRPLVYRYGTSTVRVYSAVFGRFRTGYPASYSYCIGGTVSDLPNLVLVLVPVLYSCEKTVLVLSLLKIYFSTVQYCTTRYDRC